MAGPRDLRQRRGRGWVLRAVGGLLIAIGIVAALTALNDENDGRTRAVAAGIALVTGLPGLMLSTRGKQHTAASAAAVLERDARPPVLYLRSFAADDTPLLAFGRSEEEALAVVMGEIGPFIAIGRPGEKLPTLGAARLYVGEEEWRATVDALLDRARLVIYRAGETPGFWWEVERGAARLRPEQVAFLIPHDEAGYEDFRRRVERILPARMPDYAASKLAAKTLQGIVFFHPDWTGEFAAFHSKAFRSSSTKGLMQLALRPVFENVGAAWKKPSINWLKVYLTFMATIALVGLALFALAVGAGWITLE